MNKKLNRREEKEDNNKMLRSKSNTKKKCCGSGSKSLNMMYMYCTRVHSKSNREKNF
jgi:hypothetical protein